MKSSIFGATLFKNKVLSKSKFCTKFDFSYSVLHSLLSKKKDFHFILKNQPQNCCGSTKQKLPSAKKFTESQFLGEIGWVLKKGDEAQDRAADAQLNLLLPYF